MKPEAEAELKQLVEHELRVYNQFDQASKEFMKIVLIGLINTVGEYLESKINNFACKWIARRLCEYLKRPEVVNTLGAPLGAMFTVTSRQALYDTIAAMTKWLIETDETDPGKIEYAFREHLRYWSFYREEDTEAIAGWGNQFLPDSSLRHYKPKN